LLPANWGVKLPVYIGYTQNVSTPKYDPYDQDVKLNDELNAARTAAQRDSLWKAAQDFTSITSINFTNVRILGPSDK
jgi:cell surface protein SprA